MKEDKLLVITHLYLFPKAILKRGGLIIHDSLANLKKTGKNIDVVFYLPLRWSYLKYFKFNLQKFGFNTYEIDSIKVYPIFYFPRLSTIFPKLDLILKTWAFKLFYKKHHLKDSDNVEIIYGQTLYPDGPLVLRISHLLDTPYMVALRGSDVHTSSANNSKIHQESIQVLENAHLVVSVSDKLKNISNTIFGKNYVDQILYTICKIEVFKNTRPVAKSLNKIIYIGALVKAKGIFELVDVFTRISRNKKYQLVLVGTGQEQDKIKQIIADRGLEDLVDFKGDISSRQELADEINSCDIVLFLSHNEGLPNAVVEGVACERVVICSDVGGVNEISDRNHAFQTVPSKSIDEVVNAMKSLESVPIEVLRELAQNNRKKVLKRFAPLAQLNTFKDIFSEFHEKQ